MSEKSDESILEGNVIYLVLLVLFVLPIAFFVRSQWQGASVWEDYYAKEVVKVIDLSSAGDEIWMDVHRATEIALKNGLDVNQSFQFDNRKHDVCVQLSAGRKSCFQHFRNLLVKPKGIEIHGERNVLHVSVSEQAEQLGVQKP